MKTFVKNQSHESNLKLFKFDRNNNIENFEIQANLMERQQIFKTLNNEDHMIQ